MTTELKISRSRILQSVSHDPHTGCWIWHRQIANSGYGKLMVNTATGVQQISAQLASFIAFTGPAPTDVKVIQTCGNRLCVNPEHLKLASDIIHH